MDLQYSKEIVEYIRNKGDELMKLEGAKPALSTKSIRAFLPCFNLRAAAVTAFAVAGGAIVAAHNLQALQRSFKPH